MNAYSLYVHINALLGCFVLALACQCLFACRYHGMTVIAACHSVLVGFAIGSSRRSHTHGIRTMQPRFSQEPITLTASPLQHYAALPVFLRCPSSTLARPNPTGRCKGHPQPAAAHDAFRGRLRRRHGRDRPAPERPRGRVRLQRPLQCRPRMVASAGLR